MLPAKFHRRETFESSVALLEGKIDPPARLEAPALVVLFDRSLERAVGMLLRLDHQVEPACAAAERDRLVAFSLPGGADPFVIARFGTQMGRYAHDTADIVEDNKTVGAVGNDAAGLEHCARPRRGDKVGELAFSQQPEDRRFCHRPLSHAWFVLTAARSGELGRYSTPVQ